MLSLINYVLETARIESGKTSLKKEVRCASRLIESFINIIGNSLKYTPAGGKITIDIREIPFDRENYIAYKIVVEDTGIGMSEDYLPHIFEEFSREHTSTEGKVVGTGLGLPICAMIAEKFGGSIGVESEEGKGSLFWLSIPMKESEET